MLKNVDSFDGRLNKIMENQIENMKEKTTGSIKQIIDTFGFKK